MIAVVQRDSELDCVAREGGGGAAAPHRGAQGMNTYIDEERAAILEYDAGLPRAEADRRATLDREPSSVEPPHPYAAELGRYGELAVDIIAWRRFLDVGPNEPIELCALSPRGYPWVAYPTSLAAHLALAQRGTTILTNAIGVFTTVNSILPDITARYHSNRWCRADNGRVADSEILSRRAVYIDVDAERPRGISATCLEKQAALDVGAEVEERLVSALGRNCIARGDSGNGRSLFIAIEPRPVCDEDTARLKRFMEVLSRRYSRPGVILDTTVFNAARLVPCFGTRKTKGANTLERPHRRTCLHVPARVERVPLGSFV